MRELYLVKQKMKQKFIDNGPDHKNLPFHSFRSDDLTC